MNVFFLRSMVCGTLRRKPYPQTPETAKKQPFFHTKKTGLSPRFFKLSLSSDAFADDRGQGGFFVGVDDGLLVGLADGSSKVQ